MDVRLLANQAIQLLAERKTENYRICVVIVGPPGSGKSTIAEKLCNEINSQYNQYLQAHSDVVVQLKEGEHLDLVSSISEISPALNAELEHDGGIFKNMVEDAIFKPVKKALSDNTVEIIGRGGIPNSFTISENCPLLKKNDIAIAQTIPMDGFHLSRRCLDCFKNPTWAHQRRGSPETFDSNNFLQLCRTLAQTSVIKPRQYCTKDCFKFVSETFISNLPVISIAGFDHRVKDPTPNHYSIDGYTRILVFEGLYLLYDQENWRDIYRVLGSTSALLIWNVDIEENVIEERVAKRHLESGLVNSLEEGRMKFKLNDALNARLIKNHMVNSEKVINVRND